MLKGLKSTYAFTKINELLVDMKKDEDGNYKPDRFEYVKIVDYLKMLNNEHARIIEEIYKIELIA